MVLYIYTVHEPLLVPVRRHATVRAVAAAHLSAVALAPQVFARRAHSDTRLDGSNAGHIDCEKSVGANHNHFVSTKNISFFSFIYVFYNSISYSLL